MWIEYNPNPKRKNVGDCTVRAVAKALNIGWLAAFMQIVTDAIKMCDMPSSNAVWGATLKRHGFARAVIPNMCEDCYTAEDFCNEYFKGTYVLCFGNHVATCIDGDLYDSWNSLGESPQYYWYKEAEHE